MTTGFKIRQANSEDLNQLIPLLSQLTIVGSIESSQITDHIYNNIYVLYNTHTNDIVGTITLLIEPKIIHNAGFVGHIEDVVVDEKYRGKGFGNMLVNHAISIAKDRGCYKVILDCDEDNIYFYEKCGFKQKGVSMRLDC